MGGSAHRHVRAAAAATCLLPPAPRSLVSVSSVAVFSLRERSRVVVTQNIQPAKLKRALLALSRKRLPTPVLHHEGPRVPGKEQGIPSRKLQGIGV